LRELHRFARRRAARLVHALTQEFNKPLLRQRMNKPRGASPKEAMKVSQRVAGRVA